MLAVYIRMGYNLERVSMLVLSNCPSQQYCVQLLSLTAVVPADHVDHELKYPDWPNLRILRITLVHMVTICRERMEADPRVSASRGFCPCHSLVGHRVITYKGPEKTRGFVERRRVIALYQALLYPRNKCAIRV